MTSRHVLGYGVEASIAPQRSRAVYEITVLDTVPRPGLSTKLHMASETVNNEDICSLPIRAHSLAPVTRTPERDVTARRDKLHLPSERVARPCELGRSNFPLTHSTLQI